MTDTDLATARAWMASHRRGYRACAEALGLDESELRARARTPARAREEPAPPPPPSAVASDLANARDRMADARKLAKDLAKAKNPSSAAKWSAEERQWAKLVSELEERDRDVAEARRRSEIRDPYELAREIRAEIPALCAAIGADEARALARDILRVIGDIEEPEEG